MFKLLTKPDSQPKAVKGEKLGVMTFVLHLAPADISGNEVCPRRTPGCTAGCLFTAGRGGFIPSVPAARIRKTKQYFADRVGFMAALAKDIAKAVRHAEKRGFLPAFRLNGTSDIAWHRVPVNGFANIMHIFPDAQFYDYTKVSKRLTRERLPANYHVTFSLAENNDDEARAVLGAGGNVAAVFRDKATVKRAIESGFMGAPVLDGDESDVRFADAPGSVIALYAKGRAKRDTSGFVRDIAVAA